MKKNISALLCACLLLSLCACQNDAGATEAETTAPSPETARLSEATKPNSADPLSEESILATPQVGEYAESILLANIPDQNDPLLLSTRSDGTVDYIFCSQSRQDVRDNGIASLAEAELQYYTITPDGQATRQNPDWIAQLDQTLAAGLENAYPGAAWHLEFSAWEGIFLIRAYLFLNEESQYTALYRVADGHLNQIPLTLELEADGQPIIIDQPSINSICAAKDTFLFTASYHLANKTASTSEEESLSCYVFSYDGTCVAQQPLAADAYRLLGVGDETVWFLSSASDQLTTASAGDLTPLAQHPLANGEYCAAVTPDGSFLYALCHVKGSSRLQVHRIGESGEEALISDSSFYAFGIPETLPDLLAAANDGSFYTWTLEQGHGVLRKYRHHPEGAQAPQTVTVYSLEDNQSVRTAVGLWNRTHTDIAFQYVVAAESITGTSLTVDDAITQLNTQLVNGEGPDVLILDGLPVDSLIDKGFLRPLPELDTTGVYPNLLQRFTAGDDLYAVPMKMTPYLLGRNTEESVPVTSLEAFADLVEISTAPLDCGYMTKNRADIWEKAIYYVQFTDQVFDLWYPAWSQAIWEEQQFHPEVFQEFLTQTGRLVEHYALQTIGELLVTQDENPKTGLIMDGYTIVNETDTNSHISGSYPYCLAATNYVGLRNFCPPRVPYRYGSELDVHCEITGIPGPDGTGAAVPTCIAGVRAGGHEEAGVEFLQLLLSDDVQLSLGSPIETYGVFQADGYPVKRSCIRPLLEMTESCLGNEFHIENDLESALGELNPVIPYEVPYNAAKEAALRFYEGKLTAQEAADQVADATAIYLAEQRR